MAQWANIPAWQQQELSRLAGQGQLSGVDPKIIAAIDQAESSGQGGAVNPQGYGGFFGLSPKSNYPGGHVVGSAIYGTDPASFDVQATTAGAEFAGLLGQFRGDPLRAESAYQTGPNAPYNPAGEGVGVFTSLGIGGPQTGYGITPGAGSDATLLSSSSSSSPSVQTGWPGGDLTLVPSSPLFGGVHISKSTLFRSVLMIVGLLLLLIAFNAVAKGRTDAGPISLTREAANDTADSAGDTSDGPSNVPPSRLQSDREATQRWELLNRQHKAQSAIVERTKKAQAQDQADEDVAHAEHQAAANEADPRYQAGAAQFKRNAADRRRHGNATLRRGEDVAKADVKGAPAAAAAL